jgi:hypothetical protein
MKYFAGMSFKAGNIITLICLMHLTGVTNAQISPGDLSKAHAGLEGISNCTKCHVLGNKVASEKCLDCHIEIKDRISRSEGYHASSEVAGKECFTCHNDHHGRNFLIVRFEKDKFDHNLTGFPLSSPHAKLECSVCHNTKHIENQRIKDKSYTYLGLGKNCLDCHEDYHLKSLSTNCLSCHNPDSFKPATKFNHNNTKFKLNGIHAEIKCNGCHTVQTVSGKKFQDFKVIHFSCSDCHKDPHNNKFGQSCNQCHNELSFEIIKGVSSFDHDMTNYRLDGKHREVNCKDCHKTKFTDPLKFSSCTDCHTDYQESVCKKWFIT